MQRRLRKAKIASLWELQNDVLGKDGSGSIMKWVLYILYDNVKKKIQN